VMADAKTGVAGMRLLYQAQTNQHARPTRESRDALNRWQVNTPVSVACGMFVSESRPQLRTNVQFLQ
jgi:hypothetical protein